MVETRQPRHSKYNGLDIDTDSNGTGKYQPLQHGTKSALQSSKHTTKERYTGSKAKLVVTLPAGMERRAATVRITHIH